MVLNGRTRHPPNPVIDHRHIIMGWDGLQSTLTVFLSIEGSLLLWVLKFDVSVGDGLELYKIYQTNT